MLLISTFSEYQSAALQNSVISEFLLFNPVKNFFHMEQEKLNIAATYSLLFNGSLMVDEGVGYAICFDKLVNVSGDSNLCFSPLKPKIESHMGIIWKKYQVFSKPAQKFLQKLQEILIKKRFPVFRLICFKAHLYLFLIIFFCCKDRQFVHPKVVARYGFYIGFKFAPYG